MKLICLCIALICAALVIAGCGGADEGARAEAGTEGETPKAAQKTPELREVWMTGEGWEGPSDIGILTAEQKGMLHKAGLGLWFGAPSGPTRPLGYVINETDTLGVVQQPQLAMAKAKGAPVVAIGSLVAEPTAAMIWLPKSKIRTLSDLKGKTIAIPGLPFQKEFLRSALSQVGLSLDDVKVESVGYDMVSALLDGRADASFGGSANQEGVDLRLHGAKPVVTPAKELGIPEYEELVIVARQNLLDEDPKVFHHFMAAVARGTAVAKEHPGLAVKFLKEGGESNPEISWKSMRAQVDATLPLLSEDNRMDTEQATELVDWMYEQGMIEKELTGSDLLTNDYLPSP